MTQEKSKYSFRYECGYHGDKEAQRNYRCNEIPEIFMNVYTPKSKGKWGDQQRTFAVVGDKKGLFYTGFSQAMDRLSKLKAGENVVDIAADSEQREKE